jgi:hypothetical protein
MDKNKKGNWKLKFDLIKTKSKLFCVLYVPVIISALEFLVDGYRAYSLKNKGGKL